MVYSPSTCKDKSLPKYMYIKCLLNNPSLTGYFQNLFVSPKVFSPISNTNL